MKSSLSLRLSIRFMIFVAVIVLLLSAGFVSLLKLSINSKQKKEVLDATILLCDAMEKEENTLLETLGLPYYLTYCIYDEETQDVLYTNDPFIPFLDDTDGKVKKYFVKDFFSDGNLNILYASLQTYTSDSRSVVVEVAVDVDRDSSDQMIKAIPKLSLIVILPLLLISFLISLLITKRTMKPVKEITEAAEKISSTNLETLLPVSKHEDELDKLAGTFNKLFESLKKDFDRERNFTSDVSHELKTPIAGILGQASLLKRWGKDDPKQLEQSLDLIITEANSMSAIITNLLQISKLETGHEKPLSENLYIFTLFSRLKSEFEGIDTDVQVIFDEKTDVSLVTDIELLHQVLTALISNSIKFTKAAIALKNTNQNSEGNNNITNEKCTITLKAEKIGDKIIIQEADNGPGIAEDVLPHIFERFYKGDKSHNRKAGGSGLGLSISSSIIKALNGTIKADNRTDGNGAVFTIEFSCS